MRCPRFAVLGELLRLRRCQAAVPLRCEAKSGLALFRVLQTLPNASTASARGDEVEQMLIGGCALYNRRGLTWYRELELTEKLGRKVDLRTPEELSRYFRAKVVAAAAVQYEAYEAY